VGFALAKIQPPAPRRGQLLARPALEARLRQAVADHRVVVVAAAAGYGKTALLVRALTPPAPGQGLAWVSLDPGDDLHRLLECLLAALDPFDLPLRVAPEGVLAAAMAGGGGGGTYQKVMLITAIAHRPPLLVLDEPTDAFDWSMYVVFWDVMAELVGRVTGVLMISHLLHDREQVDGAGVGAAVSHLDRT